MTILSATLSASGTERVTRTVETLIPEASQKMLNLLFERAFLTGKGLPAMGQEKVVCLVNETEPRAPEATGIETEITVLRLSVVSPGNLNMGIVFRVAESSDVNSEWISKAGTSEEKLPVATVPDDPQTLASYPADMAFSFFGGHTINLPVPSLWLIKRNGQWICDRIIDIPPEEVDTAIVAAHEQFLIRQGRAKVVDMNPPVT